MIRSTLALTLVLALLGGPVAAAVSTTCGMSSPAGTCCCGDDRACPVDATEGLGQARCCDMGTPELPAEVPTEAASAPREVPPPAPAPAPVISGASHASTSATGGVAPGPRQRVPRLPAYDLFCTYLI